MGRLLMTRTTHGGRWVECSSTFPPTSTARPQRSLRRPCSHSSRLLTMRVVCPTGSLSVRRTSVSSVRSVRRVRLQRRSFNVPTMVVARWSTITTRTSVDSASFSTGGVVPLTCSDSTGIRQRFVLSARGSSNSSRRLVTRSRAKWSVRRRFVSVGSVTPSDSRHCHSLWLDPGGLSSRV